MSSGRISQTVVDAGSEEPLPSSHARGHSIARYMLLERVGAGGMGVVWAAYDPELDRRIALKLLRPRAAGGAEAQARLLREAQAMAKLSHPHVIAIHDVGQHEGQVFLAMEFVEGDTLGRWQARTPARGWAEVVAVYVQAGRGLAAAHAAGLVHRDFKPDNVLIGLDGRVRVTDFGLARSVEVEAVESKVVEGDTRALSSSSASITQTGALVGTPAYMAPEQFAGGRLDARSDQFAFCVALWEALHRQRPFAGRTVAQLGEAVASGVIVAPPSDPHVPGFIERALRRGLAPAPDARWPDMDALLSALSHDVAGQRRRRVRLGLGLGLLATLALSVPLLIDRGDEAPAGPSCADASARLAGVWDAEVAASLEPIVVAARDGRTLWPQLVADLDAYAAEWQAMYVDACEATHVRGDQSQELLDRRMQCLDERRTSLATVVGLLGEDTRAVAGALKLLAALPAVASCGDRDYLDSPLPVPADPRAAARVREIRREVAELQARIEISEFEAPIAALDSLVDESEALGFAPLHAELRSERAIAEALRSSADAVGLRPVLEQALVEAVRVGRDDLAARVGLELIYVVGTGARDVEAGLRWADLVDAWHERSGADAYVRAMARITRGHVLAYADRTREAERAFEESLDLLGLAVTQEDLDGTTARERLALAYVLHGLSRVALGRADFAGARRLLARERMIMRGYFPRDHEMVVFTEGNLATVLVVLGEWDEALALLDQLARDEQLESSPSSHVGWLRSLVLLAEVQLMIAEARAEGDERKRWIAASKQLLARVGDDIGGLDSLVRVRTRVCRARLARLAGDLDGAALELDMLEREVPLQPTARATLELERVRLDFARGRPADALARLDALEAVVTTPLLESHPIHAAALGYRSQALHALGRSDEARLSNDEALALLDGLRPAGHPLAIRLLEQAAELEPARAVELRARAQALRDALP